MKKALAALVVLSMLLSAVALAEAADVAGTWYAIEMTDGEQSYSPADFGMEISVTLNEDGTAAMNGSGDVTEGTWTFDGEAVTITEEAGETVMTLVDGNLTLDENGLTMVFSQEAPEVDTFVPAEPIEAAAEDFVGSWKAERIGMDGQYYPTSILGADVTATIEDTTITLDGFMFSETALPLEFADGKLSISTSEEDIGFEMGITATLLEDGMLALELNAGEEGAFTFYLSRVDAAAEEAAA